MAFKAHRNCGGIFIIKLQIRCSLRSYINHIFLTTHWRNVVWIPRLWWFFICLLYLLIGHLVFHNLLIFVFDDIPRSKSTCWIHRMTARWSILTHSTLVIATHINILWLLSFCSYILKYVFNNYLFSFLLIVLFDFYCFFRELIVINYRFLKRIIFLWEFGVWIDGWLSDNEFMFWTLFKI